MQVVERWIMARLRHQQFFSLHTLNQAIAGLLEDLNRRQFKKLEGCRRDWFEQLDQPLQSVDTRVAAYTVEILHGNRRVASHLLLARRGASEAPRANT